MQFGGRSIRDISNDEIEQLILNRERESIWLDYKREPYGANDADRSEMLCDIVSFANAEGGYLIIGIEEDSNCRVRDFRHVNNARNIAESMRQSCTDSIRERIPGLETVPREVRPGKEIIIVHIPESHRKPHMVTFKNRTRFFRRYQDGKRTMTVEEIRQICIEDIHYNQLLGMEARIEWLQKSLGQQLEWESGISQTNILNVQDPRNLLRFMQQKFEDQVGDARYFRMTSTPMQLRQDWVNTSDPHFMKLLRNPPDQRYEGWQVSSVGYLRPTLVGIEDDYLDFHHMILLRNGHLEFWTPSDGDFFTRNLNETERIQHPNLYPYAICETPVNFLRLVKLIYEYANIKSSILVQLQFLNLRGSVLYPGRPLGFRHEVYFPRGIEPWSEDHLKIENQFPQDFDPDHSAYVLVEKIYNAFGYTRESIPLFDEDGNFAP